MFFEGSEKKLEVVLHDADWKSLSSKEKQGLRALPEGFFHQLVTIAGAQILSKVSSEGIDAYLLSESSLLVWNDRIVMITCGRTQLVEAAVAFIQKFGARAIKGLIFQRKNEYCERLQHSSFGDDVTILNSYLDGKSYRFGRLDLHYNYIYEYGVWDRSSRPEVRTASDVPYIEDQTCELLMYHLGEEAQFHLRQNNSNCEGLRKLFGIRELFPNWSIDDYVFSPHGYSLNGVYKELYISIHVTPEEETSYVSLETNVNLEGPYKNLLHHFIEVFKPSTYDIIYFNGPFSIEELCQRVPGHSAIQTSEQLIESGLQVQFVHMAKINQKLPVVTLSDTML